MTNDHMMSEVHLSTIEIRSVDRWKNKDLRTLMHLITTLSDQKIQTQPRLLKIHNG